MMIKNSEGEVEKVLFEGSGIQKIRVRTEGGISMALAYMGLTGAVKEGDRVLLNTTAEYLKLGSGGYHFVIAKCNNRVSELSGSGHIMKLRYTPMQLRCLAAEEQQSNYHGLIRDFKSLYKRPVVTIPLHSMLAPLCAMIKTYRPSIRVGYVMTDAAALPIAFSNTVFELKNSGVLDVTVTSGNAFGGDLETVNFYTGIIAATMVAKCDLVVVGMGPGITGTGTVFGFSGIEQGHIIDGINTIGGLPIAAVRISFADNRLRHTGISHHSLTVLGRIAKTRAVVPLPELEPEKAMIIKGQIVDNDIDKNHEIVFHDGEGVFRAMQYYGLKTTTMGRGPKEDRDFFLSVGAAAEAVKRLLLRDVT